jgi:2TM domain/Domain of unknown function (DUF4440)
MSEHSNEALEEARRYVRRKRILYTVLGIWIALSLMWFLIDLSDDSSSWWFYWPMLGTGIGVAVTAIVLVGIGGLFGREWERREIDRYLRRRVDARPRQEDAFMISSPSIADETVNELVAIERTLWSNDPKIYGDTYTADAVLIFPVVGRLDRDTAVAAIHRENAEGRAWAEVDFDVLSAQWISRNQVASLAYVATARWNYESASSKTLCATIYVQTGEGWKVALHQQTPADEATT